MNKTNFSNTGHLKNDADKTTTDTLINNLGLSVLMAKEFNIIIEQGGDGYLISEVIELPGCHTQAKSYDELIKRTREAISLYLKCQKEPIQILDKFVGIQKIAV